MGPADQDPQPGSADRGTGGRAGGGPDRLADRDDPANQGKDQAAGLGVSTESVYQRAQEAITRSRQLIARSTGAMDRCEALLRRQAQPASQEQSATDRESARSRRGAGP
jgi:hypothetical protein